MGIDVWIARKPGLQTDTVFAGVPGLKLGPGSGGVLFVCAAGSDSASKLANDISRSLGSDPVWAWPDDENPLVNLEDAVNEHLFTTLAIFGKPLATHFFAGDLPPVLGSSRVVLLPEMSELEHNPVARKSLWTTLCRFGMIARQHGS